MREFKAGDRVKELSTGDFGVVVEKGGSIYTDDTFGRNEGNLWVLWETGLDTDKILHIEPDSIEFYLYPLFGQEISIVEEAIKVLTDAGYCVTLTKKA